MNSRNMQLQLIRSREFFFTLITVERFLSSVYEHMSSQMRLSTEQVVTVRALVGFGRFVVGIHVPVVIESATYHSII